MAKTAFHWDDPLLLDLQLSEDERMIREAANAYSDTDPCMEHDELGGCRS